MANKQWENGYKSGADFKPFETRGRFVICKESNWCLVDNLDSTLVGFDTYNQAKNAAAFARAYVKKHGDIDMCSFPYDLDIALTYDHYDEFERRDRPWYYGDNPPAFLHGAIHIPSKKAAN